MQHQKTKSRYNAALEANKKLLEEERKSRKSKLKIKEIAHVQEIGESCIKTLSVDIEKCSTLLCLVVGGGGLDFKWQGGKEKKC